MIAIEDMTRDSGKSSMADDLRIYPPLICKNIITLAVENDLDYA